MEKAKVKARKNRRESILPPSKKFKSEKDFRQKKAFAGWLPMMGKEGGKN